ncbi:MAG: NAD(P)-dependent oxidoreductase [Gammaproteobacteria bacterium]|nr:NAD(P)-dependent oxidoreductase [Gammaproteobacteria bacterium]
MKVGFIGVGAMGVCMGRNLLQAGHAVTVFNRSPGRAAALVSDGAVVASCIEEAAAQTVVITMLAHDAATEAVVFDSGFIAAMPADGVHLCMATISAELARRLAQTHAQAGRGYVSAPVFGRPPAAAAAQLFIIAGGEPAAVALCQPVLDAMGQRTYHVSNAPAAANVVKITGNFMLAAIIESLGEACALTRSYGIAPTQLVEILTSSIFPAPAYKIYGGIIANETFEPPGFTLRLGLKDIRLALAAADEKEIALPLASLIRDNYLKALTRGYENLDWSALALVAQEDAGLPRR